MTAINLEPDTAGKRTREAE